MDFSHLLETLQITLGQTLPSLLGAVAILLLGWIIAVILRAGVRKGLGALRLNERLRSDTGTQIDVESAVASGVFYVILLLVLIGFFNTLNLELVSGPLHALVEQVFAFVPKLVAAAILLMVAWILAMTLRAIITKALAVTTLDEKLSAGAGMAPMSENLGNVLYWLVLLLFLPAVLGTLELEGLLTPVQNMLNDILAMLPNIFGAAIIALVGWWLAKLVRDLTASLLTATGVDQIGDRAGLAGTVSLSRLISLIVFIFILIPALIASLQALQIEAIAAPATQMLEAVMLAIPKVFAAVLILGLAFVLARLISSLLSQLSSGIGIDTLPSKLGIDVAFQSGPRPSQLVGQLAAFFIMLFAAVEAANQLGFDQLAQLMATFTQFAAQILLGSVIIAVGFWLSRLAYGAILRLHGERGATAAGIARFAILGLVLAMGLRSMGLADDIVNLAFGLTLGSIAVAAALSFGLGGRDAAGRQMEHWLSQVRARKP